MYYYILFHGDYGNRRGVAWCSATCESEAIKKFHASPIYSQTVSIFSIYPNPTPLNSPERMSNREPLGFLVGNQQWVNID